MSAAAMTRDAAKALVAAYDALVDRAIEILNMPGPPFGYISGGEYARLSFDGDEAIITTPEADSAGYIEKDTVKFPAAVLFMDEVTLHVWRSIALAEHEEQQRASRAARLAEQESTERRTYEALKRKFETGGSA
jgi:hypothetical protein